MNRRDLTTGLSAVSLMAFAGVARAQDRTWVVDPSRSAIRLQVRAFGGDQAGRFDDWDSDIVFDPVRPERARVSLVVRSASLQMQDASTSGEARSGRFLDTTRHPEIRVRLTSLSRTGPQRFQAVADVTCKGVTRAVVFPIGVAIDGRQARIDGTVVLDREDFDIGTGGPWSLMIGREVRVDVALVAMVRA